MHAWQSMDKSDNMSPLYTLSVTDPQANLSFGVLGILLPPLGFSFPLPEKFGIAMWPSNTQSLMPNCSNYARSLVPSCNLYRSARSTVASTFRSQIYALTSPA
ncbi:uncharacterized protein APUU_21784S [Aspergillus puulaauensis]|uniref:Uncharacterized protein n=1 Tax=Aspergillus puulaauensis TaxID=1220207 RepID=A0A7R7XGY7_9EURO|nr:uncharacterized protein APUU_21784S [Aspergillus puulaauensis]BCS21352.1 hypothetical protein APUU_21784S [Aspergillus puulaauensis]